MAYSQKFNPDALPAHAEPDQAAQLLAYGTPQNQPPSSPRPTPSTSATPQQHPAYLNKPAPPLPQEQSSHGYRPHSSSNARLSPIQTPPVVGPYQPPPSHNYGASAQPAPSQNYGAPSPAPPSQNYGTSSQPPGAYPQPSQSYTNYAPPQPIRSPTPSRPPIPTVGSSDASLFPLFKAVDTKGKGQLSEDELCRALVNGDFTNFDLQTVRMMIRMFDHDRSGTVGFDEFCGLWGFLAAWRTLFDRFDEDHSGYISYDEYAKALVAFGYNLSPNFVGMMYRIYDRRAANSMSFDLFVQSCISLKRMTDVFKRYDSDRDGYITLSFEEFLTEILNQR